MAAKLTKLTLASFMILFIHSLVNSGVLLGVTTAGLLNLQKLLLNLSNDVIPMTQSKPYYIRSNWKDKRRLVHVFDGNGTIVYTFERISSLTPTWSMYSYPDRREVITITNKILNKSVQYHTFNTLYSKVSESLQGQLFYTNNGRYIWTSGSKVLEKIHTPAKRSRIGTVTLMRRFQFDFEMLIDETQIEREIALATGFLSMLSVWGVGNKTALGPSPSSSPSSSMAIGPMASGPSPQKLTLIIQSSDYELQ